MPRIANYKVRKDPEKDSEDTGNPRDIQEIMQDISEESAKTLPDQKRIAELFAEKRRAKMINSFIE